MSEAAVLGLFVGGRSRRMGRQPKGRLAHPAGGTLLERVASAGAEAGLEVVLVGEASPYADLLPGVRRIADDPPGFGPLGGLSALLRFAAGRPALSVACDMPHVDADVLRRLLVHAPHAAVVAPRRGDDAPWEPLLARWDPPRVLPSLDACIDEGRRSFQGLMARLEVVALPVDDAIARALLDWDSPADVEPPPTGI